MTDDHVDVDAERADENRQWRRHFGDVEPDDTPRPFTRDEKIAALALILHALDDTRDVPMPTTWYRPLAAEVMERIDPTVTVVYASDQATARELRHVLGLRAWWRWVREPGQHDRHGGFPS
jgi:hypothetical protein